jgi:hypothetical protein
MMFTKQKHMGKGKSVARKRNVTASRSAADMAFRSLVSCLSLSVDIHQSPSKFEKK